MDNRTLELVTAYPDNKWAWYELAKRNVPIFCSLCLSESICLDNKNVFDGYKEYEESIKR